MPTTLTAAELTADLALRDLTDHHAGAHAIQLLIDLAVEDLAAAWGSEVRIERGPRVVGLADNYDGLRFQPYRPVSNLPALRRDLSVAVVAKTNAEQLGDRVRNALGHRADMLEAVTILSETAYGDLPAVARERLGMIDTQKNVLVRLVIRPYDRTLTDAEANGLRDRVYQAIHEGTAGRTGE